jgi:hypothetical protein
LINPRLRSGRRQKSLFAALDSRSKILERQRQPERQASR